MSRPRPDYDRDRRPELAGFLQKADTIAGELHDIGLREAIRPSIRRAEEILERWQRRREAT